MNMDKAVFKNLITSARPNPVENTMLSDLLHTFFAFIIRVITTVRGENAGVITVETHSNIIDASHAVRNY
jgi:hypothetical protein